MSVVEAVVRVKDGRPWLRHEPIVGRWDPVGLERDQEGQGWVPLDLGDPGNIDYLEAVDGELEDGRYELAGPHVAGNPFNLERHELRRVG